jgi:hypothetical protein
LKGPLKCKSYSNVDKGHLEPMEDVKREPYKNKGLHPKTLKPKQTQKYFLKKKPCSVSKNMLDHCKNAIAMVGPTHHPYAPCLSPQALAIPLLHHNLENYQPLIACTSQPGACSSYYFSLVGWW